MFNNTFIQFITTKSTDLVWVAFIVLAKDLEKSNPSLALACIIASVLVIIANAVIKVLLTTKNNAE